MVTTLTQYIEPWLSIYIVTKVYAYILTYRNELAQSLSIV